MCNSICIEWSMVCDGYPSCQDGSDENNCDTSKLAHTAVFIMVTVLLTLMYMYLNFKPGNISKC